MVGKNYNAGSEYLSYTSAIDRMPTGEEERSILRKRALELLTIEGEQSTGDNLHEYLIFFLGPKERYAISYEYLEEIIYANNISKVPCTPSFVVGVVNHRGTLLTIVDLHPFFHTRVTEDLTQQRIIVVRHKDLVVGVLADGIVGNKLYDTKDISEPLISDSASDMPYVRGIIEGVITVLNIEALLSDPAITVNEKIR